MLDAILPNGLKFGANYLVEFESHSLLVRDIPFPVRPSTKKEHEGRLPYFFSHSGVVMVNLKRLGFDVPRLRKDEGFSSLMKAMNFL